MTKKQAYQWLVEYEHELWKKASNSLLEADKTKIKEDKEVAKMWLKYWQICNDQLRAYADDLGLMQHHDITEALDKGESVFQK